MQPLRPYKRPATARQFKPGDPKVLRFYGRWVDTKASKEGNYLIYLYFFSMIKLRIQICGQVWNKSLLFSYIKPGSVEPIETRHLVIHFHLEDETIELAEDHDTNSGRYKAPLFLKRCKIPKVFFFLF